MLDWPKNWSRAQKIGLWSGIALLLAGLVIGLAVYFLVVKKNKQKNNNNNLSPFDLPKAQNVKLEPDARKFYTIESTDGKVGIDQQGNLVENGQTVKKGYDENVQDVPALTFELGHPFWTNEWGKLSGGSWPAYSARFSVNKVSELVDISNSAEKVLVIESNEGGEYAPVLLDVDLEVKGIVVRNGGILVVNDDKTLNIKSEFVLVESGGLLQAGTKQDDAYRFQNQLNITLTHPPGGHDAMGDVASQFSYSWYFPGVLKRESKGTADSDYMTAYTGDYGFATNGFGAKVIGIGFNGNFHLASNIIKDKYTYEGTWTSYETGDPSKKWLDKDTLLTLQTDKNQAELLDIAIDYPTTWVNMSNGTYKEDYVDVETPVTNWPVGAKVILTGKSKQFTVADNDPQGLLPIWVENEDASEAQANQAANDEFIQRMTEPVPDPSTHRVPDKSNGVEVCTIASIENNGKRIRFKNPLKFEHDSTHTVLERTSSATTSITIGTCLHVGLLSRNIKITSQLDSGGSGANVLEPRTPNPDWAGPGGSLVCNSDTVNSSGSEMYTRCFAGKPVNNVDFCNNENPPEITKGHWMFGTDGKTGSNAIFMGQSMYKNGSSVYTGGVEYSKMGTPSNFGSVARYATHFHLCGWIKDWRGYLPGDDQKKYGTIPDITNKNFRRNAQIEDCSIFPTGSRFISMHGTRGVSFKNNVGFVSYGSAVFVEDGTEIFNTIEHNLCGYCLPANYDQYYNTVPLYGNVSTDYSASSIYWLKNNMNRCFRNIGCCSPSPVTGLWLVPQKTSKLRGPSTVCVGDPLRKLPAIGSAGNAMGENSNEYFLSQDGNASLPEVAKAWGMETACYMPDYLTEAGQQIFSDTSSHCPLFVTQASNVPYSALVENVFYCVFAGQAELPEALQDKPCSNYVGRNGFEAGPSDVWAEMRVGWTNSAKFLPYNGLNACSDNQSSDIYTQSAWAATTTPFPPAGDTSLSQKSPYQPISETDLNTYIGQGQTRSQNVTASLLPKIIANTLTFNTGANGTLYGGSCWFKQSLAWFINCCNLETSYRVAEGTYNDAWGPSAANASYWGLGSTNIGSETAPTTKLSPWPPLCSINTNSAGSDGTKAFGCIYAMYFNHICNGGYQVCSSPSVMGGQKFFMADTTIFVTAEYNNASGAMNNMYFFDIPSPVDELVGEKVWQGRQDGIRTISVYDMERKKAWEASGAGRTGESALGTKLSSIAWPSGLEVSPFYKYPYVCQSDRKLRRASQSEQNEYGTAHPEWLDVTINAYFNIFTNDSSIELGDKLCDYLSQIPAGFLGNSDATGMCCTGTETC